MVRRGDFEVKLVDALTKQAFREFESTPITVDDKNAVVYVEVEPDRDYFISIQKVTTSSYDNSSKNSSNKNQKDNKHSKHTAEHTISKKSRKKRKPVEFLQCRYVVDDQSLGYSGDYGADAVNERPLYRGLWSRKKVVIEGQQQQHQQRSYQQTHRALRFTRPKELEKEEQDSPDSLNTISRSNIRSVSMGSVEIQVYGATLVLHEEDEETNKSNSDSNNAAVEEDFTATLSSKPTLLDSNTNNDDKDMGAHRAIHSKKRVLSSEGAVMVVSSTTNISSSNGNNSTSTTTTTKQHQDQQQQEEQQQVFRIPRLKRGELLDTIRLNYCTAWGLLQVGILPNTNNDANSNNTHENHDTSTTTTDDQNNNKRCRPPSPPPVMMTDEEKAVRGERDRERLQTTRRHMRDRVSTNNSSKNNVVDLTGTDDSDDDADADDANDANDDHNNNDGEATTASATQPLAPYNKSQ